MAKGDVASSITSGAIVLVVFGLVAWMLGFTFDVMTMAWLLGIFGVVTLAARRGADLEVGFVIIGASLLLIVNEYLLPDIVSDAFAPMHQAWIFFTGIDLSQVEPLSAFIVLTTFVFLMIYLRVRISGQKRFANTAADKTFSELSNYGRRYISIGRLAVFFVFSVVLIFMTEAGQLLGEVGNAIASAPVVASNIGAIAVGYVAIDGSIPGIGEVPVIADAFATLFLVLSLALLGLGVASRADSSGPLSQFVSNRVLPDRDR